MSPDIFHAEFPIRICFFMGIENIMRIENIF